MPEMNLDTDLNYLDVLFCIYSIQNYLLFPGDENARKVFKAKFATIGLERLDIVFHNGGFPREVKGIIENEIIDEYLIPNGGWSSINKFNDVTNPIKEWKTVGFLVYVMIAIAKLHPDVRGGASLNKAISICDSSSMKYGLLSNKKYIKNAWGKYRSVSHLCYAAVIASENTENESHEEFIDLLIPLAKISQDFIASYIPHGQSEPLVPFATLWTLPAHWDIRIENMPTIPLFDDLQQLLGQYRAPQ